MKKRTLSFILETTISKTLFLVSNVNTVLWQDINLLYENIKLE